MKPVEGCWAGWWQAGPPQFPVRGGGCGLCHGSGCCRPHAARPGLNPCPDPLGARSGPAWAQREGWGGRILPALTQPHALGGSAGSAGSRHPLPHGTTRAKMGRKSPKSPIPLSQPDCTTQPPSGCSPQAPSLEGALPRLPSQFFRAGIFHNGPTGVPHGGQRRSPTPATQAGPHTRFVTSLALITALRMVWGGHVGAKLRASGHHIPARGTSCLPTPSPPKKPFVPTLQLWLGSTSSPRGTPRCRRVAGS